MRAIRKPSIKVVFFLIFVFFFLIFRLIYIEETLDNLIFKNQSLTHEIIDEWRTLHQNDTILLNIIRNKYLIAPSKKPYDLKDANGDPSKNEGPHKYVIDLLQNKTGGFFVEYGAFDGETLSKTLVLERDYGWTGFMADPNIVNFEKLVTKNRKAWISNICLSTIGRPQMVDFAEFEGKEYGHLGATSLLKYYEHVKKNFKRTVTKVPCIPIFSVLLALNVTTVDFFTLDVEGSQLDILRTIPFDSILIKIFCIEWHLVPEGKAELRRFVESKGYKLIADIKQGSSADFIFVHKSVPLSQKYYAENI